MEGEEEGTIVEEEIRKITRGGRRQNWREAVQEIRQDGDEDYRRLKEGGR